MKEKKLLIYKAALELFVAEGFSGTPTSAIADKAKVANGTLFHYFPTKDVLVKSLYLEVKDNFVLNITENYDKDQAFRDRVKLIWRNIIQWAINCPYEFRYILQFNNSPYKKSLTADELSRHDFFFRNLMNEGKVLNLFIDLPVDLLLQLSLFQLYGIVEYINIHDEFIDNPTAMETAFESYWDSLSR